MMPGWIQAGRLFSLRYTGPELSSFYEGQREMAGVQALTDLFPGAFFYDILRERVTIWPVNSDNPNSNGQTYSARTWIGFSSGKAAYKIQGKSLYPYIQAINIENTPAIVSQVQQLFTGQAAFNFGDLTLATTFFHESRNFVFPGSRCYVKALIESEFSYSNWYRDADGRLVLNSGSSVLPGACWKKTDDDLWYPAPGGRDEYFEVLPDGRISTRSGDEYDRYITIFGGIINSINVSEAGATINFVDTRFIASRSLPPGKFSKDVWPYIKTSGSERPVLLGEKRGITPTLVDPTRFIYEISQTAFEDIGSFPLESLDSVYRGATLLVEGVDYEVDLNVATFRLFNDPGDEDVTIDAKGLKIARDFNVSTFTGEYSSSIADITYFLALLAGISPSFINQQSFIPVQENINFTCGEYLDTATEWGDILLSLQPTGQFIFTPDARGLLSLIPVDETTEPAAYLYNYHYRDFSYTQSRDNVYSNIDLSYDRVTSRREERLPNGETVAEYRRATGSIRNKSPLYKVENTQSVFSIIIDPGDADILVDRIAGYYSSDPDVATTWLPLEFQRLRSGNKIVVNYSVKTEKGEQVIFENQPFIILSMQAQLSGGVTITAIRDYATTRGYYIVTENQDFITDEAGNFLIT